MTAEDFLGLVLPRSGPSPPTTLFVLTVEEAEDSFLSISQGRTLAIILCIECITGIGNRLAGLLTVCIPVIATNLQILPALQLWLTAVPCLSVVLQLTCWVADASLCSGALFQTASAPGSGLAANSIQLIALRVMAGLTASFCLLYLALPRRRSIAFAAMGGAQAVGFGLCLALGGLAVLASALWSLQPGTDIELLLNRTTLIRHLHTIDLVGALLIMTGSDADQMREPLTLPCRPPPSPSFQAVPSGFVARPRPSTSKTFGMNHPLPPRFIFLPASVRGLLVSVATGAFLPRLRHSLAVPAACLVTQGPGFWRGMIQAMALNPLAADPMYTIANLVMTAPFPAKTQALVGGVFNMLAQVGKSFGIATSAPIARQGGGWYNCSLGFASLAVSLWGLRSVTRLEVKTNQPVILFILLWGL
ncbi:hypothetical protein BJX62DRAFT_223581 [Aspergillus germanicus]